MDETRLAEDSRDKKWQSQADKQEIQRYSDEFLIDKIQPEEIDEELVNVGELVADEERQIINDSEHS